MLEKKIKCIKDNWLILVIMSISLIMHIFAFNELGFDYNLGSDDLNYIRSGITFLEKGTVVMSRCHADISRCPSAQIMPGMTYLIAFLAFVFGQGNTLTVVLKVLWILMGISTINVVYKIINIYANKTISALSCLFFLAVDFIWMNNVILTETPYILLFSLLVYHTIKIAEKPNWKDYIYIVAYYILALFLRPNIGIYPLFLFIYLLIKKYNFKLLMKQCVIAGIVLLVVLTPWIYRNYKHFNKFIPLTYGIGNPLLLGTYQGTGYPSDENLDYVTNVDEKMPEDMKYYLSNKEEKPHMSDYYRLEYDKLKAEYRMSEWWKKDKISMLKSYLIIKPFDLVYNTFYWDTVLGVEVGTLKIIRRVDIVLFAIASIIILIDRSRFKEWFFLIMVYGCQVMLYAYTFAFGRYAISMFFIRYIIIGIGIDIFVKKIKKMRYEK